MLDRFSFSDPMEDLHELGEYQSLYSTHFDNRRLLHGHRGHNMVARSSATSGTYQRYSKGVFKRSHSQGENQNRQDDFRYSVR